MTAAKPIEAQPSEEQEIANAAYVWRKRVQGDFIEAMREINITLETAEWWFERYRRACIREMDAEEAAKRAKES